MRPTPIVAAALLAASSAIADEGPLAGYSDKQLFLRDPGGWFVLIPKGRLNVDWYDFLNRPDQSPNGAAANSAADQRLQLRDTVFIRRARVGVAGTFLGRIDFRVEGDFAQVAAPGQYATLADAAIVVGWADWLKLEAGQFYAPFTLENHTSENYTDFLEKAAAVRWAVPTAREAGAQLYGETPYKLGRYWIGVFDGDGQDAKNLDNRAAVIGRFVLQPFGPWRSRAAWLENVWLGGSFWWQQSTNLGGAAAPSTSAATAGDLASLSTVGGFTLWPTNYANGSDADNHAVRSHLAPDGTTVKWALEANVALGRRFGVRGEYLRQSIDVRRYDDTDAGSGATRATSGPGHVDGWAAYAEAYAWIGPEVNVDYPGRYQVPHFGKYVRPQAPKMAVEVAARYEHLEQEVAGLPLNGSGKADPAVGHYSLDLFELGANWWWSRHARLMANYVFTYLGAGDAARAAPVEAKNIFFQKVEHELLFRLQVSF